MLVADIRLPIKKTIKTGKRKISSSYKRVSFLIRKYNFKVFEAVDAYVLSSLSLLTIFLFRLGITDFGFSSGITLFICIFSVIAFFFVDKNYKKFTWYRSGKVGFTGLAVLSLFFFIKGVVALFINDMVLFLGNPDYYISFTLVLVCVFIIHKLSNLQT